MPYVVLYHTILDMKGRGELLFLTMALLSAAATQGFRAAALTCSLTQRLSASTGITSRVRPPNGHHGFATLQNTHSSVDEDSRRSGDDDDGDERSKTGQQKSRKQRRRLTEEKNLQRIDKVLAHRGVGSRSETFELAKARDRAHILLGLVIAVTNLDEVVRIIRGSASPAEASTS